MYLNRIEISGFRGINSLAFSLKPNGAVLIGENTWGKSSLLTALTHLSPQNLSYQFQDQDFYVSPGNDGSDLTATLAFKFSEKYPMQLDEPLYQFLSPVKFRDDVDNYQCVVYQIEAIKKNGKITTSHHFLDAYNKRIPDFEDQHKIISELVRLHPVLRFKSPAMFNDTDVSNAPLSKARIDRLSSKLSQKTNKIDANELYRGLETARYLLEYYLVDRQKRQSIKMNQLADTPVQQDWEYLDRVNSILDKLDSDHIRLILLELFTSIFNARGDDKYSAEVEPILLLEEPESQLHPVMLSIGMRLLNNLPIQKIATTNSSDLLALQEIGDIYRLIRYPDRIAIYHLEGAGLSSTDSRRILFHILYRRASSLFARCWLLVEGETEVWMLNELAQQSGYHLDSEGVQIIEYAQCGLRPLIKFANRMGIRWYVITDGDMAGKKYAETIQSLCPKDADIDDFITLLPTRDIENFMFRHGFSHVYKMAGYGTTDRIDAPVSRIIQKAIQRSSKPDLAIAICDDARKRGVGSVPKLLREMFRKVVKIAQTVA